MSLVFRLAHVFVPVLWFKIRPDPDLQCVVENQRCNLDSMCSLGLGNMMSAPSKSVTKSIVRSMEMNGTLDAYGSYKADVPKVQVNEIKEQEDGGEDDEGDEESGDDENEEEEDGEQLHKGNQA